MMAERAGHLTWLANLQVETERAPVRKISRYSSACTPTGPWPPLSRPPFSLYDLSMVSDEQIQQWADEAEAGYDVEELKRRGRGRPGRGAEPMQVVAVRLTADELEALDKLAKKEHLSRSEAIRRALADFAA